MPFSTLPSGLREQTHWLSACAGALGYGHWSGSTTPPQPACLPSFSRSMWQLTTAPRRVRHMLAHTPPSHSARACGGFSRPFRTFPELHSKTLKGRGSRVQLGRGEKRRRKALPSLSFSKNLPSANMGRQEGDSVLQTLLTDLRGSSGEVVGNTSNGGQ